MPRSIASDRAGGYVINGNPVIDVVFADPGPVTPTVPISRRGGEATYLRSGNERTRRAAAPKGFLRHRTRSIVTIIGFTAAEDFRKVFGGSRDQKDREIPIRPSGAVRRSTSGL